MNITTNGVQPLLGEVTVPGDKSISHRAIILSALAEGESRITNVLNSGVTQTMLKILTRLGVSWEMKGDILIVAGMGLSGLSNPSEILDCQNSGNTIRFMAGALSAAGIQATLDGSEGLRKRPMKRIISPLQNMGVKISGSADNTAPLHIEGNQNGNSLKGIEHNLNVPSAQVKTAIMLAGLSADKETTINGPAQSRDHSERMLTAMGVKIKTEDKTKIILTPPTKPLSPLNITVPGDFSSASFLIVAALIIPGSRIKISDVGLNPTRTGLIEILVEMGAKITINAKGEYNNEPIGDIEVVHSSLDGLVITKELVVRMIDEFPIFAVAASFAEAETIVNGAEELRYKETDRISILCSELNKLGVNIKEKSDGFTIKGRMLKESQIVESMADHRIAMALTIFGLASNTPVKINGAHIANESYPDFFNTLKLLGASISVEQDE